ncbi:response regulator [Skermanella rosea]|uniref:ATP-binding protein n=1 Tax=Skermanella rosea TaxID=1817965 RepID=UPI0019334E6E|nr:ATP-binding protein [Skermanella rosea]UEM05695.1 response regulator [Skermanella rosea]
MPVGTEKLWGVLRGLRLRLMLLVCCGVLPLSLLVLHLLEQQRQQILTGARDDVMTLAREAGMRQGEVLAQVRGLLQVLTAVPALREFEEGTCSGMLDEIVRHQPGLTSLWIARPDGSVPCSHHPGGLALNMAERAYFRDAVSENRFVVSDYLIGRVSGRPVLGTALPFSRPDGRIAGVAMAGINIGWLHRLAEQVVNAKDISLVLVDGNGTLLAHGSVAAPSDPPVGSKVADHPLVAAMLGSLEGTVETSDLSGVGRLFAHVALPGTGARLAVGIERDAVLAQVDRQRTISLVTLFLVAAASLTTAALAGEVLVLRWLDRLREAAARLGRGDLSVRAPLPSGGELRELAGAFNDMADSLEQREQSRSESEARFRDMAEVSSDWFWETGPDNRFTYISKGINLTGAGQDLFVGALREEIAAQPADDADRETWDRYRADLLARRPFRDFTYRIIMPGGSVRHLSTSGKPVFDRTGRFTGYRGVGRDVTREVEAEQAVRKAREAAEAANQAKSQFLAIMSHELRTPMTGVLGTIDLLSDTGLTTEQAQWLAIMRTSAETLMTVLNDILDFSKIEAGQLQFEQVEFRLGTVTREVTGLYARLAADKGLSFTVLRDGLQTDEVRGDPVRLRQVLFNLVGNALKFTERGRIEIRVSEVPSDSAGLIVRFEVEDTGIGLSEEERRHLFQAFSQADATTTRRFGGTGLGLAICKRLVEAMGGDIGVESVPGAGSTFWFTVSLERSAVPVPAPRPDGGVPDAAPRRVLLAEDDDLNRLLIATMIRRMGHEVRTAEDGARAVDEVAAGGYDIAILDLQMPVMTGLEAARRIRAMQGRAAELPLVALTADAIPERHAELQAAGFNRCLTKPVDPRQLAEAIGGLTRAIDDLPASAVR